ncbi:Claudin-10 [Varanus komodoensis]|nr:Claudin-10 [Varanus komodoensis]
MSVILELTGFVFTLSGWVIVGATLSNSYWKVSTSFGNVITSTAVYENLWQSCATDSMGISDCKEFGTLLALPAFSKKFCLEGQILKMKLKYFGHLMRGKDSLENSLMLGSIDDKRRRGRQRMRWLDGVTEAVGVSLSGLQGMVEDRKAWRNVVHAWGRYGLDTTSQLTTTVVTLILKRENGNVSPLIKDYVSTHTEEKLTPLVVFSFLCSLYSSMPSPDDLVSCVGCVWHSSGIAWFKVHSAWDRNRNQKSKDCHDRWNDVHFIRQVLSLSSMVAVSWYAARVMAEFFDSLYGGTKYELGSALYLGWAGSTLSILGGIFLTCASCKGKPK